MSASALFGGNGKIIPQFLPDTLHQAITGTATADIGTSPQTITFGGDLSGDVIASNGTYMFMASIFISTTSNLSAGTFNMSVATVGFETAALGSFSTPIPALNNTGINISVFGVIKGFGILSQSLTGTISLNSASYTTLEIRSPILIRIL